MCGTSEESCITLLHHVCFHVESRRDHHSFLFLLGFYPWNQSHTFFSFDQCDSNLLEISGCDHRQRKRYAVDDDNQQICDYGAGNCCCERGLQQTGSLSSHSLHRPPRISKLFEL